MRFKAVCAYDGSGFAGFQKQKNGLGIQSVLENALEKIVKKPVPVTASGRTDAGVHALGQVFHFDGPESISEFGYYQALNTLLPKTVRIKSVERVPDDFHARFSAKKKIYEYVISYDTQNPFIYPYMTVLRRKLDVQAMKEVSKVFLGEHDFTSFTHAKIEPGKNRVKNIESIEFFEEGKQLTIRFCANGFLRYQVRMMSAALMEAGKHKTDAKTVKKMLEAKDKEACRWNAPAQGLYLKEVVY
jgi:tRNA pseudouridine38-40 synthase